jgi:two-component system, LytTR family, sensor kinase
MYLLWIAIFHSYSFALSKTITIEFCYLVFITADFYAINNFIVPRFLIKKKYLLFISATVIIILISGWLRALVSVQMNLHFFHTPVTDFTTLFINSILNITFWVLLITIGKMLIERIKTQQQLEALEKDRIKNELDYLKAQINPHALFNSLNTIYGHIDKSNQLARNILLQFSELLRYQLYDCSAEKVSLEKEILYIKNYVAFHRLRKDENLLVNFDIGPIEEELKIAPLLLVVLIENAFKFVSNLHDRKNEIRISLSTHGHVLHSLFANTIEVHQTRIGSESNGIGITNLKRRLELLYPDKYKLTVNKEKEFYETCLTINLT